VIPETAPAGDSPTPPDPRRALIAELTAERYAPVPRKPPPGGPDNPHAQEIRRRKLLEEE
jgi:hypothetical protein